ncbi:MAG: hypothetical protein ACYTDV_15740, partial [Planctomycetota bacterium]
MDFVAERLICTSAAHTTEVRMTSIAEQHLFVVDHELEMLQAVGKTFTELGVEVTCFVHEIVTHIFLEVQTMKCLGSHSVLACGLILLLSTVQAALGIQSDDCA